MRECGKRGAGERVGRKSESGMRVECARVE